MKRPVRLLLVGGGHAHLSVLAAFAARPDSCLELVLVTPERYQYYSGMLPGFMAGHYALEQCRVDLAPLANRAGAKLVLERVVGLDAQERQLYLSSGAHLEYDLLSLDVGSAVNTQGLDAMGSLGSLGSAFLPAKPLAPFFVRWPHIQADAKATPDYALGIVGAGAAGLELALAAAHAFRGSDAQVHLIGSDTSFLAGHAASVRRRALACLRDAGVQWHAQRAASVAPSRKEQGEDCAEVVLFNGAVVRCQALIATTGAKALGWLSKSGLAVDPRGFVAITAQHQSTSHHNVFAAGDCCARTDTAMQRSGVHAVHAGPVLAHNLHAALAGEALHAYRPRKRSLYLLACGPRHAVASWGPLSAEGAWVWRWKDRIDRGFVERFSVE